MSLLICILCFGLPGCNATHEPLPDNGFTLEDPFAMPVIRLVDQDDAAREAKNRAAEADLERVVSNFTDPITLDELVSMLRDSTGANIVVNWPALELVGIEKQAPISVPLSHISADYMLRLSLMQVSAEAFDDDKAGYSIKDGVVIISTRRDLKSETRTSVYDVGWYLLPRNPMQAWLYRDEPRAAELAGLVMRRNEVLRRIQNHGFLFDLNEALSGTSSGGSTKTKPRVKNNSLPIFNGPVEEQMNNRVDALKDLIKTTVGDPDEWLDEVSTVAPVNDTLSIKTTRENHQQIEALLAAQYRILAKQFRDDARLIEVFLLLDTAEQHRLKQEYRDALLVVEKALRVDPNNAEARGLRQILVETMSR